MHIRPNWRETYMMMAITAAIRSMCIHYKTGVLLAIGNMPLCIGYNGPVRGEPHCEDVSVGCAKMEDGKKLPSGSGKCRGGHAEMNVIANAANLGLRIDGSSLYTTIRPCFECSKHIVNAGIKEVVYLNNYDAEEYALEFLSKKIDVFRFDSISARAPLYRKIFNLLLESSRIDFKGEEDVKKILELVKNKA